MTLRLEPLRVEHELTPFDCGNAQLNDWLHQHAHHAAAQGTRSYVLMDGDDRIIGYFAIAPHLVEREDPPKRVARGAPRQIPAVLLAKLALDRSVHGTGLGSELLIRALGTIVEVARVAGGKLVVVDAIDADAARFYEHHDFEAMPREPLQLVMKLSTVAAALGLPWP